ncbi:MAG: bifunctional helix-turn-helix transcriptional regulator/GNAT family N-acetyltransferase [Trebonia sp.]
MAGEMAADLVGEVRAFNRFYTNVIGLAQGMYLDMPYPLTEARLLFELAQREVTAVADVRRVLDIDPGYLSRVLSRFEADGLVTRARADGDARRQEIRLTDAGRAAAAELDARSAKQVSALLDGVDRDRLLAAMREISGILGRTALPGGSGGPGGAGGPGGPGGPGGAGGARARTVTIRAPRAGDLGWMVYRHGAMYAEEFGWNADFERWVAKIISDFADLQGPPDPHGPADPHGPDGGGARAADRAADRERSAAWIAEVDGANAGCVLCVPDTPGDGATARLRILLVERSARGLGIGARLVDEVLRFARAAGYRRITLSTYDELTSARRIYQSAGFTVIHEERERSFGKELNAQEWAREL